LHARTSDFFTLILRLFITFIAYSFPEVPLLQATSRDKGEY
jgi:hypothetical protein